MYVKEMTCSVDLYRKTYISEVVRAEFGRFSLVYVLKGRGMEVRKEKLPWVFKLLYKPQGLSGWPADFIVLFTQKI